MAYNVNKAIIVGNLTRTPSLKFTQANLAIMNVAVATNESWKNKQTGEWEKETEYHDVTMFGKLAEAMDGKMEKGQMVYVEGKIKTRQYTDKDGNERKATGIIAETVVPFQLPRNQQADDEGPRPPRKPFTPPPPPADFDDSDLPF